MNRVRALALGVIVAVLSFSAPAEARGFRGPRPGPRRPAVSRPAPRPRIAGAIRRVITAPARLIRRIF